MTLKDKLHLIVAALVLCFLATIVLMPELPIGRDRRVILHLVSAVLICLLFGSTAIDKVEWHGTGAVAVLGGSAAVAVVVFIVLHFFSRGEEVIAVFDVVDSNGRPVALQPAENISVKSISSATDPAIALDRSSLFVVFRDDMSAVQVTVQPTLSEPTYQGNAELPAHARRTLRLGKDLPIRQ